MRFDLGAARAAGYSDAEIAAFLAQRAGMNLQGAREAGHSDADIAAFLAARGAGGDGAGEGEAGAEAPAPTRPPRTAAQGAARSLGVGARGAMHMVGALPGALYDIASLPVRGAAALTGMPQPRSSAQMIDGTADALGLPQPQGRTERLINRVATEVGATGVGMGVGAGLRRLSGALPTVGADRLTRGTRAVGNALASHPGTQVAGAVGAGLAGGAVAETSDNPMLDLGASVAGGVAGAASVPILAGTARGLGSAAAMFTQGGAERAAAAALLRASDDPTTLPERLRRTYRGLDDSAPTAGELAGDSGLLQLERALRSQPEAGPLFNLRDQGRDAARVRAIEGLEQGLPGEGSGAEEVARGIDAIGQRVRTAAEGRERSALEAADAAQAQRVAAAVAAQARREGRVGAVNAGRTQQVQGALDGLPEGQVPEVAGPIIREEGAARQTAERAASFDRFAGVDPEDASRLPLQSVLAVGEDTIARLFRPLGAEPPPELRKLVDDLREWMAANPDSTAAWSNLQALRSRLVDMQNQFGSGSRANSRALAVITEMKREIDAVSRRAAEPFELPTMPRTQGDISREQALEGAAQNPDVDEALRRFHEEDMGWAGGTPARGDSFLGWIRRRGGLNFADADLSHYRDAARRYPGLISNRGMTLHRAMEAGIDSGFFPQFQEMSLDYRNAFLEALDETLRGRGPRIGQMEGAPAVRRSDVADDLAREIDRRGGVFRPEDTDETLRSIRRQSEDPEAAWGPNDPPPGQPGFVVDPMAEGWAFTPEMAARYRAAIDGHAEYSRLFERGAMGRVLGRGEAGSRSPDSVVAQQFFHGGDSGASDVRQLLEGVGERGRAAQALEAYAAQSLRDFAFGPDGRPVASRVRSWLQRHGAALRQMPEVQERFANVETAARTAQESAARGDGLVRQGARRQAREEAGAKVERRAAVKQAERDRVGAIRDWERGAARYWLKGTEPEAAIERALSAGNAERNIRDLRVALKGDAPALNGLRRAYAEVWLSRVQNSNAQHADGTPRLRSDAGRRYLDQTERAAAALFKPDDLARISQIAEDFRSGSMVTSVGRAVGSNTAQNLASLRSMSTAYILGRATQGLIRGDGGGLPRALASPLQFLMRVPEQQVMAAMADLMLDPAKAAQLTERVSAKNLDMVRRYAERNAMARFGQAAFETSVRTGSRAAGSAQAGEAQRDARRGFASGGVVEGPRVSVAREMPRLDGRRGDGRSALARYSLPAEGDLEEAEYRMPQARLRLPDTPEQREASADYVSIVQAGVPGRRPRALGGPDMRQEQRPIPLPRARDLVPADAAGAARGLGLGVRAAAQAASGLPGMMYDMAALPVHAGAAALGMEGPRSASEHVDGAADVVRLPRPGSRAERAVQTAAREIGTGAAGLGVAARLARSVRPMVRGLGEVLRDSPRMILGTAGAVAGLEEATSDGFADGGLAGGRVGILGRALGAALEPFHGSPHVFERFDLRHLGRGEGAQAFGRGHYLTESERLAEDKYRFDVLRRHGRDPDSPYRFEWDSDEARAILRGLDPGDARALQYPFRSLDDMHGLLGDDPRMPDELTIRNYHTQPMQGLAGDHAEGFLDHASFMMEEDGNVAGARAAERLMQLGPRAVPNLGATYQTRLNLDPGQLLSLDQPLRWQSGDVRRRLVDGNWGPESEEFLLRGWDRLSDPRLRIRGLEQAYQRDGDLLAPADWHDRVARQPMSDRAREYWGDFDPNRHGVRYEMGRTGAPHRQALEDLQSFSADGVRGGEHNWSPDEHAAWTDLLRAAQQGLPPSHASDELARIGIPGSRFLDGNSRSAGGGGHNFVIFQDEPIEILRRYGRGGLAGA